MPTIDTNPAHYPSNIWITDTMQKVRQDSGSPETQHWGTFYGTQNEFVDFQVHVHANAGPISNLSVTVSSFVRSSPSSYTIPNSSSQIVVYREAYMNVTGYPTNNQPDSAVPGGANYNPFYGGALGYYPDILIPAVDPYWKQTTNAWPFTVASGKNQSAWIDVLIPQGAPPGYYLGSVTVKSGSTTLATMPVIIGVWQWPSSGYMPSTSTLKTDSEGFGYLGLCSQMYNPGATTNTTLCGNYPGASGSNDAGNMLVWLDAGLLMKDHRYSNGGAEGTNPSQTGNFTAYNTYVGPLLNGTCNLHNGIGSTCPIISGSKNTVKELQDLNASKSTFALWQMNFNSNGWGSTLAYKLCDEPYPPGGGPTWATCITNANTYHTYANPGVPLMVTSDIGAMNTAGGQNAVDILVQSFQILQPIGCIATGTCQSLSTIATWMAGSTDGITRHWFNYGACGSAGTCTNGQPGPAPSGNSYMAYPNYNVDGKPAANRAMEWLTYLLGATGELYYAGDICSITGYPGTYCGLPYGSTHDPWVSIYYSGGWGDGNLVYAGQGSVSSANNYLGPSVTTPIILPSVRLKHMRDGVQDYEYLNVLKNNGKSSLVSSQIASWMTNSYTFETSGAGLQAARMALGQAMHQLSYPAAILPPPSVNGTLQLTK
jgi:hypothetical protein